VRNVEPEPAPPPAGATEAPAPASAAPGPGKGSNAAASDGSGPDLAAVAGVWNTLLPELPINVRSKWRGGSWTDAAGGLRFEVPNEWHKKACDDGRLEVEKVLKAHFGQNVPVEVIVAGGPAPGAGGGPASGTAGGPSPDPSRPAAASSPSSGGDHDDDETLDGVDIAELADAGDVATGGVELLMREFGGELVEEDPR
jgi:hypothetical protein